MKKLIFIILFVSLNCLYSQSLIDSRPDEEITKNKETGKYEVSEAFMNYHIKLEQTYILQIRLIGQYDMQINNYESLLKEKDFTIDLQDKTILERDKLVKHYESKLDRMFTVERQLQFYKSAFGINIGINVGSIFASAIFIGGYYLGVSSD